jgi:hypothetical protein
MRTKAPVRLDGVRWGLGFRLTIAANADSQKRLLEAVPPGSPTIGAVGHIELAIREFREVPQALIVDFDRHRANPDDRSAAANQMYVISDRSQNTRRRLRHW